MRECGGMGAGAKGQNTGRRTRGDRKHARSGRVARSQCLPGTGAREAWLIRCARHFQPFSLFPHCRDLFYAISRPDSAVSLPLATRGQTILMDLDEFGWGCPGFTSSSFFPLTSFCVSSVSFFLKGWVPEWSRGGAWSGVLSPTHLLGL